MNNLPVSCPPHPTRSSTGERGKWEDIHRPVVIACYSLLSALDGMVSAIE
jgi:hypothetical protein